MDLGSTTPPLGMSKEGEMPGYFMLNSKMPKLFLKASQALRESHYWLSSAAKLVLFIFNSDP